MKLAKGLILRADTQRRLQELRQRIERYAKVQEGDTPGQDPMEILAEIDRLHAQKRDLVQRINRTNSQTAYDEQMSIADALALRDELKGRQATYRKLASSATVSSSRYGRTDVRFVPTVDEDELIKRADRLGQERRELDMTIQELNWTVELVD